MADPMVLGCVFKGSKGPASFWLFPKGQAPPDMAEAESAPFDWVNYGGYEKPTAVETGRFWMDIYEVTNRAFKAFVDGGGYGKREYWKHPFVKEGKTFPGKRPWRSLRTPPADPGPQAGNCPATPGQAEFPVTGVSWYEAAAYAEFAGKQLPTISHWNAVVDMGNSRAIYLGGSNFSGHLAPVGSYPGAINGYGLFDMAGNAREWCFNAAGDVRVTLGEAASGAVHYFNWLAPAHPSTGHPRPGSAASSP